MLLTQYKKLQDVDARISDVNLELQRLYRERLAFSASPSSEFKPVDNPFVSYQGISAEERWVIESYDHLVNQWKSHSLTIPALEKLTPALHKSYDIFLTTYSLRPDIYHKARLILVPPAKDINKILSTTPLKDQGLFKLSTDYQAAKFPPAKALKNWRLLFALIEPEGLYLGTPAYLLSNKPYAIAGYDSNALGVEEYKAMVLQEGDRFDSLTSTVLLRGCDSGSHIVPSAKFNSGVFEFDAEPVDSIFGDIRFRPAIEIS